MIGKINLFLFVALLGVFLALEASPLNDPFHETGYIEICTDQPNAATYDSLYASFEGFIGFLSANPAWAQKLYQAKERFIRTKDRKGYSTDFFGLYDESGREGRRQVSFYYSTHFHEFVRSHDKEFDQVPEILQFFEACHEIQKTGGKLFNEAVADLKLDGIFPPACADLPLLIKVIKYLPAYKASRPHYDGTAFSLFLDSTDNQALLISPYRHSYKVEDFFAPLRKFSRGQEQSSILLIPGGLITEFSIYPTPHIVAESGKIRYATIAFAMRPSHTPQKIEFSPLPPF